MSIDSPAIKIQQRSVPFLTQAAAVQPAQIRGYVNSLTGYCWGKADGATAALKARVDAVTSDHGFMTWLNARDTPTTAYAPTNTAGHPLIALLLRLDHVAYDIKEAANRDHGHLCTPVTANVAKTLTRVSAGDRDMLGDVIDLFADNSCDPGEAPIQTVASLPPPNRTYRIDRENVSAAPAPRYWTYRLQIGGAVNGGILMETGIVFDIAAVRAAFTASRDSVDLKAAGQPGTAAGHFVRLSAPQWLRDILAA